MHKKKTKKHKKRDQTIKEERIERKCLNCDNKFVAKGRFNRLCPACTKLNWYKRRIFSGIYQDGIYL